MMLVVIDMARGLKEPLKKDNAEKCLQLLLSDEVDIFLLQCLAFTNYIASPMKQESSLVVSPKY